ncbi:MAG: MSMEG_4193 family putative phosphomutase [Actinomycetes bacterium]
MTTVLLVRHGQTTANTDGTLAGWTPGVSLDATGRSQAEALGARLAEVRLAALVTSPLERCRETVNALIAARSGRYAEVPVHVDDRVGECRYGDWTGQPLKKLAKDPLWKVVQSHPSAVTFPGEEGEALRDTAARAVDAIREWNAHLGTSATYAVCTHGDVIKALVADALGLHLDQFQRIVVNPASLTVVSYGPSRPFLERLNDTGGDVVALQRSRRRRRSGDAAVGGGTGDRR